LSPSACLYYSIRTIPCQDVFSTSYKKLTYRFLGKHGIKLVYRMHRQAGFMQYCLMSLDTLVILHYNKYRDYGRIWATTHRLLERGTVMKKRRFDWLRKTSSADVMNPKNYEYRLKQLDDDNPAEQKEAYTWFQKHAEEGDASAQYQTAMCFLHGVGVEKDEEQFLHWLTKSAEQEYTDDNGDSLFL